MSSTKLPSGARAAIRSKKRLTYGVTSIDRPQTSPKRSSPLTITQMLPVGERRERRSPPIEPLARWRHAAIAVRLEGLGHQRDRVGRFRRDLSKAALELARGLGRAATCATPRG